MPVLVAALPAVARRYGLCMPPSVWRCWRCVEDRSGPDSGMAPTEALKSPQCWAIVVVGTSSRGPHAGAAASAGFACLTHADRVAAECSFRVMGAAAGTRTECSFRVIPALRCLRVLPCVAPWLGCSFGAASHLAWGLREPFGEVPRRVPHAMLGMRNVRGRVVNFRVERMGWPIWLRRRCWRFVRG